MAAVITLPFCMIIEYGSEEWSLRSVTCDFNAKNVRLYSSSFVFVVRFGILQPINFLDTGEKCRTNGAYYLLW
jgi:hypothetical protein